MEFYKNIKGIRLIFENVTHQDIPMEYVKGLFMQGINHGLYKFRQDITEIYKSTSCEEFILILGNEMKDMKYDFFKGNEYLDHNETVFDRLVRCSDLCAIDLILCDDTRESISIPWEDGRNECINKLLTFKFDEEGLWIEAMRGDSGEH